MASRNLGRSLAAAGPAEAHRFTGQPRERRVPYQVPSSFRRRQQRSSSLVKKFFAQQEAVMSSRTTTDFLDKLATEMHHFSRVQK